MSKTIEWNQDRCDTLLKHYMPVGCGPDGAKRFHEAAERWGLSIEARQIWACRNFDSKRNAHVLTFPATIDGLRLICERTGEYEGMTKPEWCGADGVWHDVWLKATPPAAARVGVYRRGFREPLVMTALWAAYFAAKSPMWAKMGPQMLAKCAEALARRAAFPANLSGLYTLDEMAQAGLVQDADQDDADQQQQQAPPAEKPKPQAAPANAAKIVTTEDDVAISQLYHDAEAVSRGVGMDFARFAELWAMWSGLMAERGSWPNPSDKQVAAFHERLRNDAAMTKKGEI